VTDASGLSAPAGIAIPIAPLHKAALALLALIGGTLVSEARKPPFSPAASNRQPPFLQPFRMRSQASRTASR